MSEIHEFKCNACGKTSTATYNGEHYIIPNDWLDLRNDDLHSLGHICQACIKKFKIKINRDPVGK